MFLSMLKKSEEAGDDDNITMPKNMLQMNKVDQTVNGAQNEGAIKNKIKFLAKVSKMQRVLREERENILKIKALNDNKLPPGILLEGKAAIKNFIDCKKYDAKNEMMPKYHFK